MKASWMPPVLPGEKAIIVDHEGNQCPVVIHSIDRKGIRTQSGARHFWDADIRREDGQCTREARATFARDALDLVEDIAKAGDDEAEMMRIIARAKQLLDAWHVATEGAET